MTLPSLIQSILIWSSSFSKVFSQMIHVGVDIRYSEVESVMIACVKELENNKSKIADPGPKDDIETIQVS